MADEQSERSPYELLRQMSANIFWLETQARQNRLPVGATPVLTRLRENIASLFAMCARSR